FVLARSAPSQEQSAITILMQRELRNGEALQGVSDFNVVEPFSAHVAEANGRAAFKTNEHWFATVETKRRVVARAVTQHWKTKIESTCKRYFATFARRQRLTRIIKNLYIEPVLQQHVAAGVGISNRDRPCFIHRVQVEHRTAEA